MKNRPVEMSKHVDFLPRYYNGFDIDVIAEKMDSRKPITKEENQAFNEALEVYLKRQAEECQRETDRKAQMYKDGPRMRVKIINTKKDLKD